nr:immunoglobulin light chain junction region [Macaca mulatta]MOW31384.1 immunoglobulin light chain junction region [Macaca mulatta]MOW31451.1 immunoglobulin light chain junction region [Macaca mulatta]MOW31498.1 immunoglobulin light chain junction region [Macaca mulatta]MOW31556.1 immunoglobulin light chain junction region [Macaca mulatta]
DYYCSSTDSIGNRVLF